MHLSFRTISMAATNFQNATAQTVAQVLSKLSDQDPDLRFMSLNDLHAILSASSVALMNNDYNTATRVVEGILKSLRDQNAEVQNVAIKWYCILKLPLPELLLKFTQCQASRSKAPASGSASISREAHCHGDRSLNRQLNPSNGMPFRH